jgi:site-specific DNA recombinase
VLKDGADPRAVTPRINALEHERNEAAAKLAGMQNGHPVVLQPTTLETYRKDLQRLSELLTSGAVAEESGELIQAVRELIAMVVVYAEPNSTEFEIEIKGRLAELVNSAIYPSKARGVSGLGHR